MIDKKMGRPSKAEAEKLERTTVYMTKADRNRVEELARYRGVNYSTLMRQIALDALRQEGL